MTAMLELKDVNSFYGDAHILFNINLKIEEGQLVGLFGRNGAGKTTVLRSVMGLTPPRCEGEIVFKGQSIVGLPVYQVANAGIGFVPEDRKIFPNLTVKKESDRGQKVQERQEKMGPGRGLCLFPEIEGPGK